MKAALLIVLLAFGQSLLWAEASVGGTRSVVEVGEEQWNDHISRELYGRDDNESDSEDNESGNDGDSEDNEDDSEDNVSGHGRGRGGDDFCGPHILGIKFFNDTCPVDINADPACKVGRNDEMDGAWVCRTLFDTVTGEKETFSACVETDKFIETDVCGCCSGTCPAIEKCPCECQMTGHGEKRGGKRGENRGNGFGRGIEKFFSNRFVRPRANENDNDSDNDKSKNKTGVLIQFKGQDEARCVSSETASHLINGPGIYGRPSCVTLCP